MFGELKVQLKNESYFVELSEVCSANKHSIQLRTGLANEVRVCRPVPVAVGGRAFAAKTCTTFWTYREVSSWISMSHEPHSVKNLKQK